MSLALQDSNEKILKNLEVNNKFLDKIHEDFKTNAVQYKIKIHSFQEAQGITGIKGLHRKVCYSYISHNQIRNNTPRLWMTFLQNLIFRRI